ncbi:16S RNA G1207 methylase RsmC [Actinomycetota bacterium]|nr:16S RNA G1207 methylase RsmC [Actinomycetota bacterium]
MIKKKNSHYFDTTCIDFEPISISVDLGFGNIQVHSAKNVFSFSGLDKGTTVLLHYLSSSRGQQWLESTDLTHVLDLGCGWGPISLYLANKSKSSHIIGVDVNEFAVKLTADNAKLLGFSNVQSANPDDVTKDAKITAVVSNPPIRIGKDELHAILRRWYAQLVGGGSMIMVVQKNLGADTLIDWMIANLDGADVLKVASSKGFRIITVDKPIQ